MDIRVVGFPRNMTDVSWRLIRLSDRAEVGTGQVFGPLCGATVPLVAPEVSSSLVLDLEVSIVCPSGGRGVAIRPSYPMAHRPVGSSRWMWANLRDGGVVIHGLEYSARHELGINVKREKSWAFETRTITLSEAPGGRHG